MPPLSSLHINPAPLRSPAFLRLLLSRTISRLGSVITSTTILLHVATLTNSPLATGGVAAVQLLPILIMGLYGGHLADRFDRRRVAVLSEIALLVVSLVLIAASLLPTPSILIMYIVVAFGSALSSMQRAALDAAVPRVVGRDQLSAASAWLSAATTVAGLSAPAIGAALFFWVGATASYIFDAATFAISALCLFGLPNLQPTKPDVLLPVHRSLAEGLAYVHRRPDLRSSYLLDLVAMALAAPTTMLPFLATSIDSGASSGILFGAAAAGSLIMVSLSGWTSRIARIGIPLAIVCAVYGLSTATLSLSSSLIAAVLLLAVGGAADGLSVIFRDTLWNSTIPDQLRGRVAGVETVSYAIGAPLSGIILGALGEWLGFRYSLAIGGVGAIVLVGLIALFTPSLRSVSVREETPDAEQGQGTSDDHEAAPAR